MRKLPVNKHIRISAIDSFQPSYRPSHPEMSIFHYPIDHFSIKPIPQSNSCIFVILAIVLEPPPLPFGLAPAPIVGQIL